MFTGDINHVFNIVATLPSIFPMLINHFGHSHARVRQELIILRCLCTY